MSGKLPGSGRVGFLTGSRKETSFKLKSRTTTATTAVKLSGVMNFVGGVNFHKSQVK